jgi:hypothetical protein
VCVMPTGRAVDDASYPLLTYYHRRWQIINLSTSCPPDARLYTGGISSHFPDDRSDSTSERVRRYILFYVNFSVFNTEVLLVEAVMLTGGTPRPLLNEIQQRLTSMALSRVHGHQGRDIKLCYVTVIHQPTIDLVLIYVSARENS